MVNKNKAAASVVTADSTFRMMIDRSENVTDTIFFLHFNKNFSIFLEFFFLYKIVLVV